ncbi:MAG TPA: hypothetical protein VJW76_06290 [Verrucomicrobiae bacterium]|nr:hypothetical protein [Verrucomicrobiae bacterium]
MKAILLKLFGRASDLANVEPLIALFLGAALLAAFLSAFQQSHSGPDPSGRSSLLWTLYGHFTQLARALMLVALLAATISVLRSYLRQTVSNFQHTHGRVTQANYDAVQTIWGAEQEQGELKVEIYTDEEVTERIESEDLTKPAVLRKKMVRHPVTANPFVAVRHDVVLKQNARKKGSAYYVGYETVCRFSWELSNPAGTPQKCNLVFPLPAARAMYDDLSATLNGTDVLPQMQLRDATLMLARDLQPNEALNFRISFKSRGVSFWYFQVREAREIRDFLLTLTLPDLPKGRLNYPGGCMTPTDIQPTATAQGSVLSFRLDHAISNQGMGIALPSLSQPGEMTNAVLGETERAWLVIFSMLTLTLTLAQVRHAVLISILFGTATAFAYAMLGDFSDLLFGFVGTAVLILIPLLLLLAKLLTRISSGASIKALALQFLIVGIVYPCAAGLDSSRQTLYLNLFAAGFLGFTAWVLAARLRNRAVEQTGTD